MLGVCSSLKEGSRAVGETDGGVEGGGYVISVELGAMTELVAVGELVIEEKRSIVRFSIRVVVLENVMVERGIVKKRGIAEEIWVLEERGSAENVEFEEKK